MMQRKRYIMARATDQPLLFIDTCKMLKSNGKILN